MSHEPVPSPLLVYNNHEAQTLRMCSKLDSTDGFILACTMLYRLCILMSNSGLIPKADSITRAISLVIGRLPFSISFNIVYEIPVREANSFWDIPLASNSSLTTSPGCVGILYVFFPFKLPFRIRKCNRSQDLFRHSNRHTSCCCQVALDRTSQKTPTKAGTMATSQYLPLHHR